MKTLTRFVSTAAMLSAIWLFGGCVTKSSANRPHVQPAADFAVVESSTQKELTPQQMDDLRDAVSNYLQEQGLRNDRMYYVKVAFPAANPDDQPEWAVVRIGNFPARTYTVLSAYPGADDYYPYDYYPYGNYTNYGQFSGYGYYEPFDYSNGVYSRPPALPRYHRPDEKPDRPDYRPDRPDDKRDRPHARPDDSNDSRNRWQNRRTENPRGTTPDQRRDNTEPRDADRSRWNHNRSDGGESNRTSPRSVPDRVVMPPSPARDPSPAPSRPE